MTIGFHIKGLNGNLVDVSSNGDLFARTRFSSAEKITLVADDVPITIVKPRAHEKMVITGLIVNTNRDIVGSTLIQIYESAEETSSVVSKAIMSFDLVKNQTVVTMPILIETTQGVFINAIADDSDVNVTLLCYFARI